MAPAEAIGADRDPGRTRAHADRDRWFPLLLALGVLALFHLRVALTDPGYWTGCCFDEHWYVMLAEQGPIAPAAGYTQASSLAFGPAWPLLIRAVSVTTGMPAKPAALLLAGLLLIATTYGFARLAALCGLDRRWRRLALAMFALSPAAYVLPTAYAEALYVPLLAWTLVLVGHGRLMAAALLAAAAAATRSPGLVLVPTLAVAGILVRPEGLGPVRRMLRAALPAAVVGLGFGAWMLWLARATGDPTAMLQAYAGWNPVQEPWAQRLLGAAGPTALWQSLTLDGQRWSVALGSLLFLTTPPVLILARDVLPRFLTLFGALAWLFFLASSASLHPIVFRNILRHGLTVLPFWLAVPVLLRRYGVPPRSLLVVVLIEALLFQHFVARFVEVRWVS